MCSRRTWHKAGNSECVDRLLAGESGSTVEKSVRFGFTQVNGFAVSKGVGAYAGHRWGLLVRAKTDDALASVYSLQKHTDALSGSGVTAARCAPRTLVHPKDHRSDPLAFRSGGQTGCWRCECPGLRSRKDEVGQLASSFTRLVNNMKEQAGIVEAIASGKLDTKVSPKSDKDVVMIALGKAVGSLQGLDCRGRDAVEGGGGREACDARQRREVPGRIP